LGVARAAGVDEVLKHDLGGQHVAASLLLLLGQFRVRQERVGFDRRVAFVPEEDVDAGNALEPAGESPALGNCFVSFARQLKLIVDFLFQTQ
jgi:hypothetical protein